MTPAVPTPQTISDAAANAWDTLLGGGVADLRPTPRRVIDEGHLRTVFRYLDTTEQRATSGPILLVPPLAAPTRCFDLRRGCSMAEHLISLGHATYLLEYGDVRFADRQLGLEHWVSDVIPKAVEAVRADADSEEPVAIVAWCLGGIMSLLSVAAGDVEVGAIATIASPFDFTRTNVAPLLPLMNLTGGALGTAVYRALGGAPAPLVKRGYQLFSLDKYVTKPYAIATHLHDRDFLAQVEAVDAFTAGMHAYPGRTMGQLYHSFFRANELADGRLDLAKRTIDLAEVRVPVLSIAGGSDVIAPRAAVHHVEGLLPNAAIMRIETAPGGHLGALAGRAARRTTWRYIDDFLADAADLRTAKGEQPRIATNGASRQRRRIAPPTGVGR